MSAGGSNAAALMLSPPGVSVSKGSELTHVGGHLGPTSVLDLKYHARAVRSARLSSTVQVAGGIQDQVASGVVSIDASSEVVDNFVSPRTSGDW